MTNDHVYKKIELMDSPVKSADRCAASLRP